MKTMPHIVGVALIVASSAICSEAHSLANVRLYKDGSVHPPGDKILASVVVLPGVQNSTIVVRPIEVSNDGSRHTPIRASQSAPADHRDADGNLAVSVSLDSNRSYANRDIEIVVPYSDFTLDRGEHKIYYEVSATHTANNARVVAFMTATRLTIFAVSRSERKEMISADKSPEPILHATKVLAYTSVDDQNGDQILKKLEKAMVSLPQQSAPPTIAKEVAVNIPGGFDRTELAPEDNLRGLEGQLSDFEPQQKRLVRFATNRKVAESSVHGIEQLSGDCSADVTYGTALVNIPIAIHRAGQIESSRFFQRDPDKVFIIDAMTILRQQEFYDGLAGDDIIVFVHGFCNTAQDAVFRTAQLQHDLEFGGRSLAFIWPSCGTLSGYEADENMVNPSAQALASVLQKLASETTPDGKAKRRIHIIAHSMGSRILLRALHTLTRAKAFPEGQRPFGQLVFAAPDVDLNEFASKIPLVVNLAQQVSYYYSSKDIALGASGIVHPVDRAGMFPFFYSGMNTINVDNANSRFMSIGHDYFSTNDRLLLDLNLALLKGFAPEQRRPPLNSKEELKDYEGFAHYSFQPLSR